MAGLTITKTIHRESISEASANGHADAVRALLEAGSEIPPCCMDSASAYGHVDVVGVLLEAGAEIQTENPSRDVSRWLYDFFAQRIKQTVNNRLIAHIFHIYLCFVCTFCKWTTDCTYLTCLSVLRMHILWMNDWLHIPYISICASYAHSANEQFMNCNIFSSSESNMLSTIRSSFPFFKIW